MQSSVQLRLASLEKLKHTALDRVRPWPATRQAFRASPAQWSAVDVIDHLEKSERAILAALAAHTGRPVSIGMGDRLKSAALITLFRRNVRVKAPPGVTSILPCGTRSLTSIATDWAATRVDLTSFLQSDPPSKGGIFRHPVAGWMSLDSTLAFLESHIVHHCFQLDRIEKASA